ncbi:DMT family transporter [Peribacillus frigoritolerans]|nr:DMT family transporter [Peribacillus frigoritolerans]
MKFRLPKKEDLLRISILAFIGISIYHIGVTFGEQTVSAGTAGMLIGSAPVFIAIIAAFVLKERLGTIRMDWFRNWIHRDHLNNIRYRRTFPEYF